VAVLRQHASFHAPQDFGLGLAVTAFLAGLLVLACFAVASIPTEGPRAESRAPEAGTTYIDISAEPPASPIATH
jgi:hypothetical protein